MVVFYNILDVSAYNAFVVWTEIDPGWNGEKTFKRRLFLEELGKSLVSPFIERREQLSRTEASVRLVRELQPTPTPSSSDKNHEGDSRRKRKRCQSCPANKDRKSNTCKKINATHARNSIARSTRLSKSGITERGCTDLISALTSNPSHLTELDLSENTLGNAGVKHISTLLKSSSCKLQKLVLSDCSITGEGYTALVKSLMSNPSHLKELDLRGNDPGTSGLKELRNLMKNAKCKPKTLRLSKSGITERGCTDLISALTSNPSHLTELDLSENTLGNAGVKQISTLLKSSSCKLQKLVLSDCSITEEGYTALAEALKSSHLIELDLRGNDPGDSGVKLLTDLLQDPDCTLNTVRLLKSADAEEACECLTNIVGKNPLLHKELNLSNRTPEDIKVNQLLALLQDPHYRLQKLTLFKVFSITDNDFAALISALVLNPSHLRELNLNWNKPGESGLRNLCDFLKNYKCKLHKLILFKSVSVKSCTDVVSALCTNPSHIRELDLSECELGDSGVEKLCDLLKKHECKLETLTLMNCSITDRHCAALTAALKLNSSHLKLLDLRKNKLGNSVTQLEELLQRSGGRLVHDNSSRIEIKHPSDGREQAACTVS
ncbi:ribonuclease inhibitor-like [Clarias gariepinus]|uniref:ribonuclease inhibitor-like n=1 Tax=Clarias gariepinus TaxID=13013 RepID=UPI00234C8010|nr:ribonuclease inhibitor-like [Clarias gariepinus]